MGGRGTVAVQAKGGVEQREQPLHRSLTQPILLGGAERELAILEGTVIACFTVGLGFHLATIGMALVIGTVGHSLLKRAARHDPQMSRVYIRHVRYRISYPARADRRAAPRPVVAFNFGVD